MKTRNAMQLKALVNNYAVENRLIPQIVLQNYHLQRFVERLVRSKYRKKFVIKGGLLLSALYGLDRRTTMDIDATVTGIAAGRESLAKALHFFGIILIFAIGAGIGGVLSNLFGIRTIWVSTLLLLGVTLMMVKK